MSMTLEATRQELLFVSELHTKQNIAKRVHGERIRIPVENGMVDAVFYRANPDSPTIITAYGGGFIMGGCALDDHMWTTLRNELHVNILSVGYRKGPGHAFPTALQDLYGSICWFAENKESLGITSDKIAVMGFSAGANLAAATAIVDRDRGTNHISLQILNYPYLDLVTDPENKGHYAEDVCAYRLFPEFYAPDEERTNPLISPVYQKDASSLPQALVVVAGSDPLYPEGTAYFRKLVEAGVKAELFTAKNMSHGYLEFWFNLTDPEATGNDYLPEHLLRPFENGTMKCEVEATVSFIKKALETW